jgi:intracellular septation protein
MNTFLELLPVILFIVAYKLKGIYVATAVLMFATLAQSIILYVKNKKLTAIQLATLALVLIFGTATLAFHNEKFIKIKPTVLYWFFAIALEVSWRYYKKNLAEKLLRNILEQNKIYINKQEVWTKTHHFSAAFFWALGLINLILAYNYSLDTWVSFKAFGFPILTMVGLGGLMFWLFKHKEEEIKIND